MTKLWQLLGASDIQFDEMTKLDYFYVAGWTSTLSGLYESAYDGALRVAGSAREARAPRFVHVRPLVISRAVSGPPAA